MARPHPEIPKVPPPPVDGVYNLPPTGAFLGDLVFRPPPPLKTPAWEASPIICHKIDNNGGSEYPAKINPGRTPPPFLLGILLQARGDFLTHTVSLFIISALNPEYP